MWKSVSAVAPTINWVLCPAGANLGAWRYFTSSSRLCCPRTRICPMGARMACFVLSGARVRSPASDGSSILTLSRSARNPICSTSSGAVPGMALAWM